VIEFPDLAVPRPVAKAASVVHDREADVAGAKQAVDEATRGVSAALVEDRERFASALDRGDGDPGREAEDAARHELDECERRLAVEEVRLSRARDALDTALNESINAWTTALERAVEQADADTVELVGKLAAAEHERARRRHALTWARRYQQGEKLPSLASVPQTPTAIVRNVQASPYDCYPVAELVEAVRVALARASLAAERQVDGEPHLHVAGAA
jgi:hypothetical protein